MVKKNCVNCVEHTSTTKRYCTNCNDHVHVVYQNNKYLCVHCLCCTIKIESVFGKRQDKEKLYKKDSCKNRISFKNHSGL